MTGTRTSLKQAKAGAAKGAMVIVRPSELAKNGTTGTVAEGIYEGAKPNKFNALKSDYFIRNASNDTLYILNETQSLKEQLGQLSAEDAVQVEVIYNGKVTTKNGKGYHDFEVFASL